jgi:SPP1 gp7 family putative phage head morphogenesis protein
MSAIDDLLKKHRQAIIDREENTFRQIIEAYRLIEKELQKEFKKLQGKIQTARDNGDEISIGWILRQNSLKEFIESVKNIITEFGSQITPNIIREQSEAANIAIKQATEMIDTLTNVRVSASLPRRVIENVVGLMGDGSPLLDYYKETLAPAVVEKIRQEVIKGVALGTNFNTIARRLTETGDITRQRALSVARTEVNRVRRETTRQIYQENSDIISSWEWVAAKSTRTCVLCLAMDGTIFKLKDEFPQHVNCRCTMIPVMRHRPKRTLGKDWFNTLSDIDKEKILGKDAFAAWQNGDIKDLKDFVGWKNDKRFGKSIYRKPLAQILADQNSQGGAGGNWRRFNEKFNPKITKQISGVSCVSAVGEMLLKGRGIIVSQEQIRDIIGEPASVESLAKALNIFDKPKAGKLWKGHAIPDNNLEILLKQKQFGAFIADDFILTKLLHAVIVKGKTRSGLIKIEDSFDQTSYEMLFEDFIKHFGGQVIYRL